jgi:hypothetical protein
MKRLAVLLFLFIATFAVPASAQKPTPQPKPTPPELTAEIKKIIDDNTPSALPQRPVAKRDGTDAGDSNLKGRVKTIIHDKEVVNTNKGRNISWIEEFDSRGNLIRKVSFDWARNPSNITVYGYLEGARVSSAKGIFHNYDPPAALAAPSTGKAKPAWDPRFDTKYDYIYTSGRLTEKRETWSNGELSGRSVYEYDGNKKTSLYYGEADKLGSKTSYILNAKGDEIERLDRKDPLYNRNEDVTWVFTYDAFDEKGNWTQRTMHKVLTEIGGRLTQPYYIDYRRVTYYP